MLSQEQKEKLIINVKDFFKSQILPAHIQACARATKLSNYNIHPFLLKYLASFLEGNTDARSIAKALIYPRVLGTSINTIFGNQVQKMISELFEGLGSVVPGIDIEFTDSFDGRLKYCQLKAGPNTINKDDVPIINSHFRAVKNLARINNRDIRVDDMIVGIIYGTSKNLSGHYKKIQKDYPVYVGQEFWYRLTGDELFYEHLITAVGDVVLEVDGREQLEATITTLTKDIDSNLNNYL